MEVNASFEMHGRQALMKSGFKSSMQPGFKDAMRDQTCTELKRQAVNSMRDLKCMEVEIHASQEKAMRN